MTSIFSPANLYTHSTHVPPTEEPAAGQGHVCVVGLPLPPRSAESAPAPQVHLPHSSPLIQTLHPLQHSGEGMHGHFLVVMYSLPKTGTSVICPKSFRASFSRGGIIKSSARLSDFTLKT